MALTTGTKTILAFTGIILVGVGVYWFVTRRKDIKAGNNPSGLFGRNKFKMGYIQNGYIHIAGEDRQRANKFLLPTMPVTIKRTDFDGEYTIDKVWKDANGNIGAFTTKETSVGNNKSKNTDYENKGIILV